MVKNRLKEKFEWRAELSDTILKGTHPGTIPARLGLIWFSGFRGEDLNVKVYDVRQMPSDGKSSHGLWPGELKSYGPDKLSWEEAEVEEKIRLKPYVSLRSKGRHNYSSLHIVGPLIGIINILFYSILL